MKYFIDTHNRESGTFPSDEITSQQFVSVFKEYEKACNEEGVTIVSVHLNLKEGKAFCFDKAPDEDAIRRAHEKVNFPYDSIVEVNTVSAGDLLVREMLS